MAEPGGGKDFDIPGFSAKDGPLKGKENGSAKSKRGRKAKFNNDADLSRGSQVGKGASGKTPAPKEPPKYDLNVEEELPPNAECLMDCEAADILQGVHEKMTILSRDPTIKLPPSFDQSLQYAKSTTRYTDVEAVKQVLQNLKNHGISDGEICMIANAGPESITELFSVVPTLKGKGSNVNDALRDALSELEKVRCAAEHF